MPASFHWTVRAEHGTSFFEHSTGEVSGHWVPHEIVQPVGEDPGELTALFRDPGVSIECGEAARERGDWRLFV